MSGSQLLECIEGQFRRYLAIDERLPLVLALWSMATHVFECFDAFPYLAVTSPTKRCGKTRVAEVLDLFCARPMRTVGMTPAVLFRSIQATKPTLIVDEAESLRFREERANALREILNAGYRKGQKVRRCEGDSKRYGIREFETYCPKVLVAIGDLPDTLADRAIRIEMRRPLPDEQFERFLIARAKKETAPLAGSLKKWASHRAQVEKAYAEKEDLPFLKEREAELWLPLFVVCEIAAPHRCPDLDASARHLSIVKNKESDELSSRLLADVREVFQQVGQDRLPTVGLLRHLHKMQEAPWHTYRQGNPLDAHALARFLRPFKISSSNLRLGKSVAKGYQRRDFEDAWARYLCVATATPLQGPETLVETSMPQPLRK